VQGHHHLVATRDGGDGLGHEGGRVGGGEDPGLETHPGGAGAVEAVDPEGAPVVPVDVPCHQVPPLAGGHESVWLDVTRALLPVATPVVEADPLVVATGMDDRHQHVGVDCRSRSGQGHGVGLQGVDPPAQPQRQHLLELGQGPQRGLLHAYHRAPGCGPQAHGNGHRLVVVQQQGRHGRPRLQAVPAAGAGSGVDGVAELAQPIDVTAQGAGTDLQALRQVGARHPALRLQDG
jgi:hypothetical protein